LQQSHDIAKFTNAVSSIRIRGDAKISADDWQNYYLDCIKRIDRGLFQMTLHPGCYDPNTANDQPFGERWRNRDYAFLENCDLASIADQFQINLTNWAIVDKRAPEKLATPDKLIC
jgi:hypothetical protein